MELLGRSLEFLYQATLDRFATFIPPPPLPLMRESAFLSCAHSGWPRSNAQGVRTASAAVPTRGTHLAHFDAPTPAGARRRSFGTCRISFRTRSMMGAISTQQPLPRWSPSRS
eukprot:scaffold98987_cov29-Tisochrysis_lutea.AAC.6